MTRTIGIDIGAETIKIAEIVAEGDELNVTRRAIREHRKEPASVLVEMLGELDWDSLDGAAVTGRMSRQVRLPRIPVKQAQMSGFELLVADQVNENPPPTEEELRVLRDEVDKTKFYI